VSYPVRVPSGSPRSKLEARPQSRNGTSIAGGFAFRPLGASAEGRSRRPLCSRDAAVRTCPKRLRGTVAAGPVSRQAELPPRTRGGSSTDRTPTVLPLDRLSGPSACPRWGHLITIHRVSSQGGRIASACDDRQHDRPIECAAGAGARATGTRPTPPPTRAFGDDQWRTGTSRTSRCGSGACILPAPIPMIGFPCARPDCRFGGKALHDGG
jgi:hypothetical protein